MALIKCNECGKEISDSAANCPHCGKEHKDVLGNTLLWGGLFCLIFVGGILLILKACGRA